MKNIANIFGRVALFTLPILFILFPMWIAEIWGNPWITVITVTTGYILYVIMINIVNKWQGFYWEDDLKRTLILIAATTLALVIMRTIYQVTDDVYKMGSIQFVITGGCMLIVCALIITEHQGSLGNLFSDLEDSFNLLFSLFGISCFSLMYSFWATWLIWFPVALMLGVIAAIAVRTIKESAWEDHLNLLLLTPLTIVAVGLISLVWQFWHGIIYGLSGAWHWTIDALQFPVLTASNGFHMPLWVPMVIFITITVGRFLIQRYDKSQKKKAEEKKEAEEAEKQKQKTLKANQQIEEKKKEDRKKLFTAVMNVEKPSWKDIINSQQKFAADKYASAPLLELLDISAVKMQLRFGSDFKFALGRLNEVAQECYDDQVLEKVVNQMGSLNQYKDYTGYEALQSELISQYTGKYAYLLSLLEKAKQLREKNEKKGELVV